jgi:hypothetical protein
VDLPSTVIKELTNVQSVPQVPSVTTPKLHLLLVELDITVQKARLVAPYAHLAMLAQLLQVYLLLVNPVKPHPPIEHHV